MKTLSTLWNNIQRYLFPSLNEKLGELTKKQRKFITVMETIEIGNVLDRYEWIGNGRKPKARFCLFKCFVAKSVFNIAQNKAFIDYIKSSPSLRRLCGYESVKDIPSETTFSRVFQEFSDEKIPEKIHEATVKKHLKNHLMCHKSTDASAIEAQEKAIKKNKKGQKKYNKGRPKKGEQRPPKEKRRLEKQVHQNFDTNMKDLPTSCDHGSKKDSKGNIMHWTGYKLHLDVVDGDIPISALVTSASLHDSQAAIPLFQMSSQRVTTLYDLMDAAYDAPEIHDVSWKLGHVPIIDDNPRSGKKKEKEPAQKQRFKQRSSVERVFSNLKDNFAGKNFRVKGHHKVAAHLMFGILSLTAIQIIRLIC